MFDRWTENRAALWALGAVAYTFSMFFLTLYVVVKLSMAQEGS
jgi:hypothetical protein